MKGGKDDRGIEDASNNNNNNNNFRNTTFRRASSDEEAGSLSSRTSFDIVDDDKRLLNDDPLVNPLEIDVGGVRVDQNGVVKVDWTWICRKAWEVWGSWRSVFWLILMVWGNCTARGLFRGDFREYSRGGL